MTTTTNRNHLPLPLRPREAIEGRVRLLHSQLPHAPLPFRSSDDPALVIYVAILRARIQELQWVLDESPFMY